MFLKTNHIVILVISLVIYGNGSKGFDMKSENYSNKCGENAAFRLTPPLASYTTRSKLQCSALCQQSDVCEGFNFSPHQIVHNCDIIDARPSCGDLVSTTGAAFYIKDALCPERQVFEGGVCVCMRGLYGPTCESRYRDCSDYARQGITTPNFQNLYIWPIDYPEAFLVHCYLDWGGFTYIQENHCANDGIDFFNKDWNSYKEGFGSIDCQFWIGLEKMHYLTKQADFQLAIEIRSSGNANGWYYMQALYDNSWIDTEANDYALHLGLFIDHWDYPAGDSIKYPADPNESANGMPFSTFDRDNDNSPRNCAQDFHAGFWFNDCAAANPNGWYVLTDDMSRNTSVPSIMWKNDWGHHAIDYFGMRLGAGFNYIS